MNKKLFVAVALVAAASLAACNWLHPQNSAPGSDATAKAQPSAPAPAPDSTAKPAEPPAKPASE